MEDNHNFPLVSVVLATYNGEQFLRQQLDSILAQTYSNLAIVAIDDNSSDDTIIILNDFATKHQNVKVYQNKSNLGFIKNFDKGCSLSTGDFIALCDQDDYWSNDKIEKLVNAIGNFPMIYSDSYLCRHDLQKMGKKVSDVVNCMSFTDSLQQAIFCRIYGHATLFTRSLYKAASPFLTAIPHDWWLSYVATLHGGIKYLDEPLVYYRQHDANLFGVVGGKKRKHQKQNKLEKKRLTTIKIRQRIEGFYNKCPDEMVKEKKILLALKECYKNFSLKNNVKRVILFLKHRNDFLMVKKQSSLHKLLFCFKMFAKIK